MREYSLAVTAEELHLWAILISRTLRRLSGDPVPPENFILAEIDSGCLGKDQPDPASPDEIWPEAPQAGHNI